MKLNSSVLFVKDIEASKLFYTEIIGLDILHDYGSNIALSENIGLWSVGVDHPIMLHLEDNKYVNRTELYFEEEQIEDCFNKLKLAGVRFFQELQEEAWGQRNFRFFDPDNHLIEVGEPVPVFVNNMKTKGMSNDAISKQTGIPLNNVEEMLGTK